MYAAGPGNCTIYVQMIGKPLFQNRLSTRRFGITLLAACHQPLASGA